VDQIFITDIKINQVRHLKNIEIPLSKDRMKHLIITGKNGSGKTSLLDALAVFLNSVTSSREPMESIETLKIRIKNLQSYIEQGREKYEIDLKRERVKRCEYRIETTSGGVILDMNVSLYDILPLFSQGKFVTAYYKADRIFKAQIPQHVEKVALKKDYSIKETPRQDFVKYLLDLKMTQALAVTGGKKEKADQIAAWFQNFDNLLKRIFDDDSVELVFDEETFQFTIHMEGRDPFDFNELSSGYAAVLDIVVDLIIRMESQTERRFDFSVAGIVLIDEIETHLHLELQRKILDLLTSIFPNIQFILSTHSPFIINSVDNAVIYDLEKNLLVENGLSDVPYAGIVEGYFNSNEMSMLLQKKFNRYKELVNKEKLTDEDYDEISELEMYLNEIPDYLALNITTEYQRLKEVLRSREDI
jgi:predicted ATPase